MIYCCSIENYIKTFFSNKLEDLMLSYETAASYLGLANEDGFPLIFHHTIYDNINSSYMNGIYVKEMDLTNIKIVNGIICTDEERTICELIKYDRDIQCVLESLNKYMSKNESIELLEERAKEHGVGKELGILIDDALDYYND